MVKNPPLVSIIIPAYNAEDYLAETLDSLISQSFDDLEIIVVDDGSTDGTKDVVEHYSSSVKYVWQENSGGCSSPRNTGFEHSSGALVGFLDADDIAPPDRTQKFVDFFNRHKEVDVVFGDYRNFNSSGYDEESHFQRCAQLYCRLNGNRELVLADGARLMIEEGFVISGAFMVRRNRLEEVGLFDESLKAAEDFHLGVRMSKGANIGILNAVVMLRRLHDSNMTSDIPRMSEYTIQCLKSFLKMFADEITRRSIRLNISKQYEIWSRYFSNKGEVFNTVKTGLSSWISSPSIAAFKTSIKFTIRSTLVKAGVHQPD